MMTTRTALLAILAATLAAAGCGEDEEWSPSAPEATEDGLVAVRGLDESVSDQLVEVVATVRLDHGGEAAFLDLGEGHIGIGERAPQAARLVTVSMMERMRATPLEVYLAIRPAGVDVPEKLLRDHQRMARFEGAAATPRILDAPEGGAEREDPLTDPGSGSYSCERSGSWVEDWKDAFVGITKYREAAYYAQHDGGVVFYPGAPVYYGTNINSITYLGACNGHERVDLVLEVHRRYNAFGAPWPRILTVEIPSHEKYTFYSGISAAYRGFIYGSYDGSFEHAGIGAAWTLSPGEAIP